MTGDRYGGDGRGRSDERSLEARDALGVVFDGAVLKLLAVVLAGWWMLETGETATAFVEFRGGLNVLYEGVAALTTLVGMALLVVGALALLVKLVYEATRLAERD